MFLAVCAGLALAAGLRPPAAAAAPGGRWLGIAGLAGSTQPDSRLADYQWDTRPHLAWGAKAAAGHGGWSGGFQVWRSRTTQDMGSAGADPAVHQTRFEFTGAARVARWLDTDLSVTAGGGWMRLAYHPEEMTLDTGAGTTVVRFAPIVEPIVGAGFAVSRRLAGPWRAGLDGAWRRYALDTAHRSGSEIVLERTAFSEWSARLELAWTRGW